MSADVESDIEGVAALSSMSPQPVSETTSLLPKPATKEQRSWFRQATPAKLVLFVILASLSVSFEVDFAHDNLTDDHMIHSEGSDALPSY